MAERRQNQVSTRCPSPRLAEITTALTTAKMLTNQGSRGLREVSAAEAPQAPTLNPLPLGKIDSSTASSIREPRAGAHLAGDAG